MTTQMQTRMELMGNFVNAVVPEPAQEIHPDKSMFNTRQLFDPNHNQGELDKISSFLSGTHGSCFECGQNGHLAK